MSTDIEKARAVAADMLRQAGDETGARVLERAGVLLDHLDHARTDYTAAYRDRQWAFDLLAYLDPEGAKAELLRAHGKALAMNTTPHYRMHYAMVGLSEMLRLWTRPDPGSQE